MNTIGRYEILAKLGTGGMGIVYRGRDTIIGRDVAIKTLRLLNELDPDTVDEFQKRFYNEARAAGMLAHPNIVTIYDVGEHEGTPFIAMEYVSGTPLSEFNKAGRRFKGDEIWTILSGVGSALDYAHDRGVIHRDLKPANLIVGDDLTTKIVDFGIARLSDTSITKSGAFLGTPSYMAPEQAKGESVDRRADLFSFAVIAYELLTGQQPFSAPSFTAVLMKIVAEPPVMPHGLERLGLLPAQFEAVFERALAKRPDDRYTSAAAFLEALAPLLNNLVVPDEYHIDDTSVSDDQQLAAPPPPPPPDPEAVANRLSQVESDLGEQVDAAAMLADANIDDELESAFAEVFDFAEEGLDDEDSDDIHEWVDVEGTVAASESDLAIQDLDAILAASDESYEALDDDSVEFATVVDSAPPPDSAEGVFAPTTRIPVARPTSPPAPDQPPTGPPTESEPTPAPPPARTYEPRVVPPPPPPPSPPPPSPPPPEPAPQPPRPPAPRVPAQREGASRGILIGIAATLVLIVVGGLFALMSGDRDGQRPAARPTATPAVSPEATPTVALQPTAGGPAEPKTYRLIITSVPSGANVVLDGFPRGTTPLTLDDLEAEEVRVTVGLPGYRPVERRVTLTGGGEPNVLQVELEQVGPQKGRLRIRTRPKGARVEVDGRARGQGPVTVEDLAPGPHRVRVSAPGYTPQERSVTVRGGAEASLTVRLVRPTRESRPTPVPTPSPAPPSPTATVPQATPTPEPVEVAIEPPVLIERAPSRCPGLARRLGQSGTAILQLTIGEDGSIRKVTVLKSAGKVLDGEAIRAAKASRFKPARRGDETLEGLFTLSFSFNCR